DCPLAAAKLLGRNCGSSVLSASERNVSFRSRIKTPNAASGSARLAERGTDHRYAGQECSAADGESARIRATSHGRNAHPQNVTRAKRVRVLARQTSFQ